MLYYKTDCPHCGNEITVRNEKEPQKCRWCRRLVSAKFRRQGKKVLCEVERVDFPEKGKRYDDDRIHRKYQRKGEDNG